MPSWHPEAQTLLFPGCGLSHNDGLACWKFWRDAVRPQACPGHKHQGCVECKAVLPASCFPLLLQYLWDSWEVHTNVFEGGPAGISRGFANKSSPCWPLGSFRGMLPWKLQQSPSAEQKTWYLLALISCHWSHGHHPRHCCTGGTVPDGGVCLPSQGHYRGPAHGAAAHSSCCPSAGSGLGSPTRRGAATTRIRLQRLMCTLLPRVTVSLCPWHPEVASLKQGQTFSPTFRPK